MSISPGDLFEPVAWKDVEKHPLEKWRHVNVWNDLCSTDPVVPLPSEFFERCAPDYIALSSDYLPDICRNRMRMKSVYFYRSYSGENWSIRFADGLQFTDLLAMDATGSQFDFEVRADQAPNMEYLTCWCPRTKSDRQSLLDFNKLRTLQIIRLKDAKVMAGLPRLRLEGLGLTQGVKDLSPLTEMPGLEAVSLRELRGLHSIAPLKNLPNLREVIIAFCPAIEDIDVLLELPQLKSLTIFSCRNIGFSRIQDAIEQRGLDELYFSDVS